MSQDPLVSKSQALFHALVSNWANELRGDVTAIQNETIRKLDELQDRMSKYKESIDEGRIEAFSREATALLQDSLGPAPTAGRVPKNP